MPLFRFFRNTLVFVPHRNPAGFHWFRRIFFSSYAEEEHQALFPLQTKKAAYPCFDSPFFHSLILLHHLKRRPPKSFAERGHIPLHFSSLPPNRKIKLFALSLEFHIVACRFSPLPFYFLCRLLKKRSGPKYPTLRLQALYLEKCVRFPLTYQFVPRHFFQKH